MVMVTMVTQKRLSRVGQERWNVTTDAASTLDADVTVEMTVEMELMN